MKKDLRKNKYLILLITLKVICVNLFLVDGQNINIEFININGKYYQRCENGYINELNLCIKVAEPICPENYRLFNGLCYHLSQITESCQNNKNLISPCNFPNFRGTSDSSYIKSTTQQPEVEEKKTNIVSITKPDELKRCPPHYVLHKEKCRQVFCSKGELYQGRCLLAACPENTVWFNHKCQSPEYITTIIEIKNKFINETMIIEPNIKKKNSTEIEIHTPSPLILHKDKVYKKENTNDEKKIETPKCCKIYTPRVCKFYKEKWICFNKAFDRCSSELCVKPKIFLKPPETVFNNSILIMAPNPNLNPCPNNDCTKNSRDKVDCSGCAQSDERTCSPECYKYFCQKNDCTFLELENFCSSYPSDSPCIKSDGCVWEWCK